MSWTRYFRSLDIDTIDEILGTIDEILTVVLKLFVIGVLFHVAYFFTLLTQVIK